MVGEILELFKSPVTAFTKRAEERNIKKEAILAGIIAIVLALSTIITSYITITKTINKTYKSLKKYNESLYFGQEEVTKSEFKEIKKEAKKELLEDAELGKAFFRTLVIVIVGIALVAGILFVIARMLKSPKDYIEMLAMANSAYLIYLLGFVLNIIFSYIYAPIDAILLAGAIIFAILALANSFRENIQIEDPNKLVIYSTIVLTVVVAVLIIIAASYVKSLFSLTSLL